MTLYRGQLASLNSFTNKVGTLAGLCLGLVVPIQVHSNNDDNDDDVTDDDTDDDSTPEDAGRGWAGGGDVVEQLLHPHQTPGQGPGHLGV